MFMHRSVDSRRRVRRMFAAVAHTLRWSSGTIFGREVVPEVWRTSAMSSGPAMPPRGAGAPPGSFTNWNVPAGSSLFALISSTGTPSAAAAARAGVSSPSMSTTAFALKSDR